MEGKKGRGKEGEKVRRLEGEKVRRLEGERVREEGKKFGILERLIGKVKR